VLLGSTAFSFPYAAMAQSPVGAQDPVAAQESITSFRSDISVNLDRDLYAVRDVVGSSWVIDINGKDKIVSTKEAPHNLKITPVRTEVDNALARMAASRVVQEIHRGAYVNIGVGLPDVVYAGNHGLEIAGRGLSFLEPAAAAARDELRAVTERLESALSAVPGAFVEYKVLTTSVHYRNVAAEDVGRVEQAVREAVGPAAGLFRLGSGKMLWEILPRTDWNKGAAVRWILDRLGEDDILSIYFGDDQTDENAFRALPDGLTFKVGCEGGTDAKYRVTGPLAVEEFLEWLAKQ